MSLAIGGSMIEEWVTNDVAQACIGATADANGNTHGLWDVNVRPFLDMTIKAWLYYQGALHGCGVLLRGESSVEVYHADP